MKQNASVFIEAKFDYKGRDGNERHFEIADTRYGVVFTGKKLPGGQKADVVYLLLHDAYWELLNNAPVRPLDYTYLKKLSPSAQRWYEIVSYRIFGAIKYHHPEAKILYSEYCLYSAAPRYNDYKLFKAQMRKIHKPHRESGYLAKAWYETTTDDEGNPDWLLFYTPGPKALAEYKAFHKKRTLPKEEIFLRSSNHMIQTARRRARRARLLYPRLLKL